MLFGCVEEISTPLRLCGLPVVACAAVLLSAIVARSSFGTEGRTLARRMALCVADCACLQIPGSAIKEERTPDERLHGSLRAFQLLKRRRDMTFTAMVKLSDALRGACCTIVPL